MFSTTVADSMHRSHKHTTMCGSEHAGSSSGADAKTEQTARAKAAASASCNGAVEVPAHVPRPVTVLDVSGEVTARPVQVCTTDYLHMQDQCMRWKLQWHK
jgi:hypothetical protein